MKLSKLKQQEADLQEMLKLNHDRQKNENTRLFLLQYGVEMGDLVKFTAGNGTSLEGVLTELVYEDVIPVAPIILQFKSNGKIGKMKIKCPKDNIGTFKFVRKIHQSV